MQIIGRDNISQSGKNGLVKIDNNKKDKSSLLKVLIITIIGGLIVSGLAYWIGWTRP